MFKTSEEIIVIQAEATTPLNTGVVFWSHDKGTAKLITQLKKGHINQTLSQGTIVPILLEFNSDTAAKGKGRHIYHAVIENALEGIVSIVLEDNILGYVGRVDGSVYIELPDSRSLDTAGRFTFDIKRSPIDEDVPELEDYYWQGFNDIMEQYHESITEIKSEAKALLDSLTACVTAAQNKVSTLEQSITTANTNLNASIDEINKKIDDNDVFTKAEGSANVISQVIGKEKVELTFTTDFDSKISGSVIENPNIARHNAIATLPSPKNFGGSELSDLYYELVRKKDTRNFVTTQNVATRMSANLYSFSILECLKRELGDQFFSSLGAKTDKQCVEIIRKIVSYRLVSLWASGKSFEGNKVNMRMWSILTNSWLESSNSTSSEVKLITMSGLENTNNHYITDDGKIHILAYAEASDGNVASTINTDYVSLTFKINISVHDFIESTIAANHIENLAAQEEAEAGEDNTKTMTPLRVFQSIAKWTKDKFVSMTENETVLGIKNFANGLQVNGRNVLSQKGEIVFDHTSETDSSIQSGIVRFKRYGDWILVNFNFQCRSTDIASGGNLIGVLEADIIPS
ncbi:BppU family phage baseplate upper protein, partial [Enterococcus sp.]